MQEGQVEATHELMVTFSSDDGLARSQFAKALEDAPNGRRSEWDIPDNFLITPGVADEEWKQEWQASLDNSRGALVIFSEKYKAKLKNPKKSALKWEAQQILEKHKGDSGYCVFVMDPAVGGQSYRDLRFNLDNKKPKLNVEMWKKFVAEHCA